MKGSELKISSEILLMMVEENTRYMDDLSS